MSCRDESGHQDSEARKGRVLCGWSGLSSHAGGIKVVPLDEVTQRVGWALLEARGMGGGGRGGATM